MQQGALVIGVLAGDFIGDANGEAVAVHTQLHTRKERYRMELRK